MNSDNKSGLMVIAVAVSPEETDTLLAFLENTPLDESMAFVVIPAGSEDFLPFPELVGVKPLKDGAALSPGGVHLCPSGMVARCEDGRVCLSPVADDDVHPLDSFLTSMAEKRREGAIAVVLAGLDERGLDGLRAVKAAGGRVLVQDPTTAWSDIMPRAVIKAGLADSVLRPDRIGLELQSLSVIRLEDGVEPGPAAHELVAVVDADGHIIHTNAAFGELMPRGRGVIGKTCAVVLGCNACDAGDEAACFGAAPFTFEKDDDSDVFSVKTQFGAARMTPMGGGPNATGRFVIRIAEPVTSDGKCVDDGGEG